MESVKILEKRIIFLTFEKDMISCGKSNKEGSFLMSGLVSLLKEKTICQSGSLQFGTLRIFF